MENPSSNARVTDVYKCTFFLGDSQARIDEGRICQLAPQGSLSLHTVGAHFAKYDEADIHVQASLHDSLSNLVSEMYKLFSD